jgi:ribosomal-protein-alanine N-acetyltransferase
LLVTRVEGQEDIVGYIGYRVVIDEMHIVIIAVHPAWRRRGIARSMLCAAMVQARQAACTMATLEVRVSNTAAQQLYYRLGFAPVGVRPRYYTRPTEDALILWRNPL